MKHLLILTVMISFLFSCKTQKETSKSEELNDKLVPFSTQMITTYNLTAEDLKRAQFYLGGSEIRINNLDRTRSVKVDGDIEVTNTDVPLEVKFPKGVKGIAQSVSGSRPNFSLAIRFEQEGSNRFLTFMPNQSGTYYFATSREGTIMYDGKTYNVNPESANAYLEVRVSESFGNDPKKRTAPGVPIGTGGTGVNTDAHSENIVGGMYLPDNSTTNETNQSSTQNTGLTVTAKNLGNNKVELSWTEPGDYSVLLQYPNGGTREFQVNGTSIRLNNLPQGQFVATVTGQSRSGSTSFTN